jgi:hypothetical protein
LPPFLGNLLVHFWRPRRNPIVGAGKQAHQPKCPMAGSGKGEKVSAAADGNGWNGPLMEFVWELAGTMDGWRPF